MKYYAHLNFMYQSKNKAFGAAQDHARTIDGTLIKDDAALFEFWINLSRVIDQINLKFMWCKTLEYFYHKEDVYRHGYISVDDCFSITFMPVNHEFNGNLHPEEAPEENSEDRLSDRDSDRRARDPHPEDLTAV